MIWVFAVISIIVAIFIAGSLLPKEIVVSRTLQLKKDQNQVWKLISDFPSQVSWRTRLKKVEKLDENKWIEIYKSGWKFVLETIESKPPELLVRELTGNRYIKGTWMLQLAKSIDGCWLTLTEKAVIENPFFRFLARYVIKRASHIEEYLRDVARFFGETPIIE